MKQTSLATFFNQPKGQKAEPAIDKKETVEEKKTKVDQRPHEDDDAQTPVESGTEAEAGSPKKFKRLKRKHNSDDEDDSSDAPTATSTPKPEEKPVDVEMPQAKAEEQKETPLAKEDKPKEDKPKEELVAAKQLLKSKPVAKKEPATSKEKKSAKEVEAKETTGSDKKPEEVVEKEKKQNEKEEHEEEEKSAPQDKTKGKEKPKDDEDDDADMEVPTAASLEDVSSRPDLWKKGDKVPYSALAKTLGDIESTTKRLKITEYLSGFFLDVLRLSPSGLVEVVYICANKLAPAYEGLELGLGESILMKAIADATGRTLVKIKEQYIAEGDLGSVAQSSRNHQSTMFKPAALNVPQVFKTLKEIASISGGSSQAKKVEKIKGLLVACRDNEAKFLIRSLEGKLRIGLAEQTVLVALGQAAVRFESKKKGQALIDQMLEGVKILKRVYSELPNYDKIVPALIENGIEKLPQSCSITAGIPLKPMLAHPTKSIASIFERFEGNSFTCEFKYDGERNQIHRMEDGKVLMYSRNSENLTPKYPDLLERLMQVPKPSVTSFILDSESVAWDKEQKKILPFQVLSTRKRKDVEVGDVKVQVCLYAFDLLYLNGKSLLQEPLKLRRQLLRENFIEMEGAFEFAKSIESTEVESIESFLDESIKGNCEGLMVKTLEKEATYEPSKRSHNWLKVKKDYLDGMSDSVDLVVVGAYVGRGKRTGRYGGYLLACYNDEADEFQTICKIGTGFTDADLDEHYNFFKDKVIPAPKSYYRFSEGSDPDVWLDNVQVWEVKAADLSISPTYQAGVGLVDSKKGISLRFPRFIRVRDDKNPEDASNSSFVADLYKAQNLNRPSLTDEVAEDDY